MSVIPIKIGNLEYSYAEGIGAPHCFTTRLGGVSTGIFNSLNLNFSRGDDPDKVVENFRLIGEVLGFTPEDAVNARQIHSDIAIGSHCSCFAIWIYAIVAAQRLAQGRRVAHTDKFRTLRLDRMQTILQVVARGSKEGYLVALAPIDKSLALHHATRERLLERYGQLLRHDTNQRSRCRLERGCATRQQQ